MTSDVQEIITSIEHTRLPWKHPLAHDRDLADLRLDNVKQLLEKRLETLGNRMESLHDQATEIDPKGFTPTPRSNRIFEIHDRFRDAYWSIQTRLTYVKQALTLISDAQSESYDRRCKVVRDRKKRAAK